MRRLIGPLFAVSLWGIASVARAATGEVTFFVIPTSDLARSQAFYGALFGWTFDCFRESDGTCQRAPGGAEFRLIKSKGKAIGSLFEDAKSISRTGAGIMIAFTVDDIRKAYAEALASGGESKRGPICNRVMGFATAVVLDPDHNPIELHESPCAF